jgi:hypothetical protein
MLIYIKKKKKTFYGQTDRQTDARTTQNYSSEPHKKVIIESCTKLDYYRVSGFSTTLYRVNTH